VRITYIVVKNFARFMKEVTPESISFDVIGVDPDNLESVRKFLEEECSDLDYDECKSHYIKTYLHGMVKKDEEWIEQEALTRAEQDLSYYLGTTRVSEAFKKIYAKYGDAIYNVNMNPRSVEDYPELSMLFDYMFLKYKCSDVEIARVEDLARLSSMIDDYEGDPEKAYYDFKIGYNLRDASRLLDLSGKLGEIGVLYPKGTEKLLTLVCHLGFNEEIKYMIVTHNLEEQPLIVMKIQQEVEQARASRELEELRRKYEELKKRYDELWARRRTLTREEAEELENLEMQLGELLTKMMELEQKQAKPRIKRGGYIALVY